MTKEQKIKTLEAGIRIIETKQRFGLWLDKTEEMDSMKEQLAELNR